jgi:hypothetical protein
MDPRGYRRTGGPDAPDVPDMVDGVDVGAERPETEKDGSDLPWAGVGVVVLVAVAGAFVTGWHFGRRWGRLMGW